MKKLKTIEEANNDGFKHEQKYYAWMKKIEDEKYNKTHPFNGIACPKCGKELRDSSQFPTFSGVQTCFCPHCGQYNGLYKR